MLRRIRTASIGMGQKFYSAQFFKLSCFSVIVIWIFITLEINILSETRDPGGKWALLVSEKVDVNDDVNELLVTELRRSFQTNQLACPSNQRPLASSVKTVDSEWQQVYLFEGRKLRQLFIYSAFYDDRPSVGFLPMLRLVVFTSYHANDMRVFCHIWYPAEIQPYVTRAQFNYTGMNEYYVLRNNTYDEYREYTFSCPLPTLYPVPTHVSLTFNQCEDNYTTFKRVIFNPRRNPQFDFGVCVVNGYGDIPIQEFVEWMEIHMILGVAEINLYDSMYSKNLTDIFEFYKNKGVLRIRPMPHPFNLTKDFKKKFRTLRTTSLNDCMLRNMYRYRYIVVIDHDEVVVPTNAINYRQLLKEIDKDLKLVKPSHSYTFYNLYFLLEFPQDESKPKHLKTLRYRHRADKNNDFEFYATKSFVSPLYCFSLFNHYCAERLPPYEKDVSTIVPMKFAGSFHYRFCGVFYKSNCSTLYSQKTLDNSMLRYESHLTERVESVLKPRGIL